MDRYYSFHGNKLTLISDFSLDKDGQPLTVALVNEKVSNGDLIFSPYTLWQILIEPKISSRDDPSYQPPSLQPFVNQFDLRLNGKGSYVQRRPKLSELNIQKYYNEDVSVAAADPFTRSYMCDIQNKLQSKNSWTL